MFYCGFDGIPGMSGMSPSGGVDNNEYYDMLGVSKTADMSEIKKAYRALVLVNHPDRGGDTEKFKQIQAVYETLCDPEKKANYDKYGKEGQPSKGIHPQSDIFSNFFGANGHGGARSSRTIKGDDITHKIKVTLNDLYNGKTSKLAINKKIICFECEGRGGKPGCEVLCQNCRGHGTVFQIYKIGYTTQQFQKQCVSCNGKGRIIDEKNKCSNCKGNKTVKQRKVLEVYIEKGMKHNDKIYFRGESNELPNTIAGDVIIILDEIEHEQFKRKGNDLLYIKEISLCDSLCGTTFLIQHFDGRSLKISTQPRQIISHESVKAIHHEGMPQRGNPFNKGTLFIQFKVIFPKQLNLNHIQMLQNVLPPHPRIIIHGNEEEVVMLPIDLDQFIRQTRTSSNSREADDNDDNGQNYHQHINCPQG